MLKCPQWEVSFLYRECTWRPFTVAVCHVFESMSAESPWNVEEGIEKWLNSSRIANILQIYYSSKSRLSAFRVEICKDFGWGVTLVSVIWSMEVSATRMLLCTVNCKEWFGTAATCLHSGDRGSPLSKVPRYCDDLNCCLVCAWTFHVAALQLLGHR